MSDELTEQEKRLLTEALGECWHEPKKSKTYGPEFRLGGALICEHCGGYLSPRIELDRINFADGRVTMRLMGLVGADSIEIIWIGGRFMAEIKGEYWGFASTKEIAIAKAVAAYLKEK